VDHPATLARKRFHLSRFLPQVPSSVRFVEIDFNNQNLLEVLKGAGFEPSRPAVFLWEGVTNYLSPEAVDSVLAYVSSCAPGSRIIFTYVHADALSGSSRFEGAQRRLEDVTRIGEPWTFGLDPSRVVELLERALCLECDLSADDYRNKYFGSRSRQMKGYSFYHVAVASVPTEERFDAPKNQEAERRTGA
jgi:methyltransferase (TIGR00027 family)